MLRNVFTFLLKYLTSLSTLHNYFNNPIKLFSHLYLVKFLDTWAKFLVCKIRFDKKKYYTIFSLSLSYDFVAFCVLRSFSQGEMRTSNETKDSIMQRLADILYTVMAISRALRSWAQEGVFRERKNKVCSSQEIDNRTVWPVTSFPKMILTNSITHVARHYSTRWMITVWPAVLPRICTNFSKGDLKFI